MIRLIVRALRLLKVERLPSAVHLVKCTWLSVCISEKSLLDPEDYSLPPPERPTVALAEESNETAFSPVPDVAAVPEIQEEHHEEDGVSQNDLEALISGVHPSESNPSQSLVENPVLSGKWVCSQPSTTIWENHNKHITDKLEPLAKAYTHTGDKRRALGYSKAINALKSYHKPITSYEEACKIPGIGKRMADKIMEIMESAHLRKLDHIGEEVPMWYQQVRPSYRELFNLNAKEAAHSVDTQLVVVACGSYRRGKSTCGDVDILITHPDGESHKGVFSKVLHLLHQNGMLLYHRKMTLLAMLDIIVVPYAEFACALLYFTGSAHFNRSMRALAKTKHMSLSEHSLNCAVVRQRGVKLVAGTPLHTPTE
uniref:DNA-directed DNA polymerase n=1 Tax=Sinocyclocheilus rhinocerous TaxID=307959 RepID=A0A673GZE2_9TELE